MINTLQAKPLTIAKIVENNLMATDSTQLLLRIPAELRAALQREADAQGRKLTQEINRRLRDSLAPTSPPTRLAQAIDLGRRLPASYTAANASETYPAKEQSPADALTDIDRAMLAVFRAMPPEKQLALLSLFR